MDSKSKYRQFCETEGTIPIFSQNWWLDAVCGAGNWDVVVIEKGGMIVATLPYQHKNKFGLNFIDMPPLTQSMGPWLRVIAGKSATQYARQKELLTQLIRGLPKFDYFNQNFNINITNWLPFFWNGFKETTRYTYLLEDLDSCEQISNEFTGSIRREIKKAKNRFKLNVRWDINIETFYTLNEMTFERQGRSVPYDQDIVKRIDDACAARNARKIIGAEDQEGRLHAAVYLIWDRNSAYYLMGGSDPRLRNSGAFSLCMWEAINFAARVNLRFDFEGSMQEPIERFFRHFGARQVAYFNITYRSKVLKRLNALKTLIYPD